MTVFLQRGIITMNENINSAMKCFFNKRTKQHIDYVIEFGKKLDLDFTNHDADKYSPELIEGYVLLTWSKNHDNVFVSDDEKLKIKEAIKKTR